MPVQETFLRALRNLSAFEGRSTVKTWLFGILKNVLRETAREQGRSDRFQEFTEAEMTIDSQNTLPPDEPVQRMEFWDVVEGRLQHLPERTAKMFWAVDVEERSTQETADQLGVSQNIIWVILHRAHKVIRGLFMSRRKSSGL